MRMPVRTALGCALAVATALLAGCGSGEEPASGAGPRAAPPLASATASTTSTAVVGAGSPSSASASSTPAIGFPDFCSQAELSITRWELPPALTDQIERGAIELRYRIPPGAEPLTIWMGVDIEVGAVTIGDVLRLDPSQQATFPNADPSALIPASVMSHGFDVEPDGRTRTIEVAITLPSEQMFDGASGWGWSNLTRSPFEVSDPWVLWSFRADGVRVRLDGEFCTPILVPLP